MNLKHNLVSFLAEFKAECEKVGRKPEEVNILYAVKYLSPPDFVDFIKAAKELKLNPVIVGENRVQAAFEKMSFIRENRPELLSAFNLIMIGPLQSNKINRATGLFDEIQSIDTIELAGDLNSRLKIINRIISVYLEVNISGEQAKHGFRPEELDETILAIKQLNNLAIKGLMTMAPKTEDEEKIREVFRKLRILADQYKLKTSMGMSHDWKIAIEEGSDMVRIGNRVFT